MPGPFTKSQIDKLGQRLRAQTYQETELTLLDEYRRSFGPAYDRVVEKVHAVLGVPVSGRPAKSTTSIIEKLNRESIRLSQIQDIAGCRIVVSDSLEQNRAVETIAAAFENVVIQDRRTKPSHGYRAVHVIVNDDGRSIEAQVRTAQQQVWAELSEKFADVIDASIKYGGGPSPVRKVLDDMATQISEFEELEAAVRRADHAQRLREMREEWLGAVRSIIQEMNDDSEEAGK